MSKVIDVEGQAERYQTMLLTTSTEYDTPSRIHLATLSDGGVELQSPAFHGGITPHNIYLNKTEMDALCDAWTAKTGVNQQQRIAFLLVTAEALLLNLKRMIEAAHLAENANNTAPTTDTAQYIEAFVARISAELTNQDNITPDQRRAAQNALWEINHPQAAETPAEQFPF